MDRRDIAKEMARTRLDFHDLVDNSTVADLRELTQGTKWTNDQLLFHMLFGYLLVRNLMVLVRILSRLPVAYPNGSLKDSTQRPGHFKRSTTWVPSVVRGSSATRAWSSSWTA